jgi:hypothetical protein
LTVNNNHRGTEKIEISELPPGSYDIYFLLRASVPVVKPFFGATNLVDYAGNMTAVGIFAYCNDDELAATDNISESSDPLFESCGLTGGGGDWQLQINNLPPGSYDIYCYTYLTGLPSGYPVTFTITSGGSGSTTADDSSPIGVLSVTKSDYSSIVINISGEFEPVCNGIQILNTGE